MNCKLFVGNLPYTATEDALREVFAAVGSVQSAKVISDQQTGRPRGFGFVEMATEGEAHAAIEQLHRSTFGGRQINVSIAQERERTDRGGSRPGRGDRHDRRDRAPRESRW